MKPPTVNRRKVHKIVDSFLHNEITVEELYQFIEDIAAQCTSNQDEKHLEIVDEPVIESNVPQEITYEPDEYSMIWQLNLDKRIARYFTSRGISEVKDVINYLRSPSNVQELNDESKSYCRQILLALQEIPYKKLLYFCGYSEIEIIDFKVNNMMDIVSPVVYITALFILINQPANFTASFVIDLDSGNVISTKKSTAQEMSGILVLCMMSFIRNYANNILHI